MPNSDLESLIQDCLNSHWVVSFTQSFNTEPAYVAYISNIYRINSVESTRTSAAGNTILEALIAAVDKASTIELEEQPYHIPNTEPANPLLEMLQSIKQPAPTHQPLRRL